MDRNLKVTPINQEQARMTKKQIKTQITSKKTKQYLKK